MKWLVTVTAIVVWLQAANAVAQDGASWPGFRGEGRDARVAKLPKHLNKVKLLWSHPLPSSGVGGVAATDSFVVVSSRDALDKQDLFICIDPVSGTELWKLSYPSKLNLDYGNSPRATPLIVDPWVYLLGAGGELQCVDLDSGKIRWKKHLVDDLQGERPPWGYSASPLVVGDKLIVQPGGSDHAIAALNGETGEPIWFAKGDQAAYAAPQVIRAQNIQQLLCWDRRSLIALDLDHGKRLWTITPEGTAEFHVPMPLATADGIITIGEVHGVCFYPWKQANQPTDPSAAIAPETLKPETQQPTHQLFELAPDMHSPVITGNLLLGVHESLYAVDLARSLQVRWQIDDPVFQDHTSLFVDQDRLLVVTERSELLLVDLASEIESKNAQARIVGRKQVGDAKQRSLAYPALVGDVLFMRTNSQLIACAIGD